MATYKEISGFNIKSLATDPSNLLKGEIWYNSTSGTLKVAPLVVPVWASGGTNPYTAYDACGFGTPTAAVICCGNSPPQIDTANEYNGTSFSPTTAYPSPQSGADGDGPQTAGLVAGGYSGGFLTLNCDYNGTAWSVNPVMDAGRSGLGLLGNTAAQTAAIAVSGEGPSAPVTTSTSDYNGSSWTAGAAVPTWKQGTSAGGTTSAGIAMGGTAPIATNSLIYNGSSWSAGPTMNSPHVYAGGGGLATAAVCFGGTTAGSNAATEDYDGSSWGSAGNMATAVSNCHGKATIDGPTAFVATGSDGSGPARTDASQVRGGFLVETQTVTTS